MQRTGRHLSDQRADRVGAGAGPAAAALPRAGRGTGRAEGVEARKADPRRPRQPAVQRLRRGQLQRGRAGADRALPARCAKYARRRARASTTYTCGSSAWPSGASSSGPGTASSASSPTTRGWTACHSPACASATWTRSTSIRIDCLNGDKYKTGKVTPDGPVPSLQWRITRPSTTEKAHPGRDWRSRCSSKRRASPLAPCGFRHFWGVDNAAALLDTAEERPEKLQGWRQGALRPELAALAQPCRAGGGPFRDDDLKLAAGWAIAGRAGR